MFMFKCGCWFECDGVLEVLVSDCFVVVCSLNFGDIVYVIFNGKCEWVYLVGMVVLFEYVFVL